MKTEQQSLDNSDNHVVITGMGLVCAVGDTLDTFAASLKLGHSGIRSVDHPDLPIQAGALITDFDYKAGINSLKELPPALLVRAQTADRRAPYGVKLAVYSVLCAWQQAGLSDADLDTSRIGLIIAGQNLSSRDSYDHYQRYQSDPEYLPAIYGLHFLDTYLVGMLSEILQIQGPGFTIGGASATGNVGMIQGSQLVRSGVVDVCVVVGAMADVSPLEIQAWKNMGAVGGKTLTAEQSCRPFDRAHEGFVYGQGCGCVILENKTVARQRGTDKLATLAGTALTLDGYRLADPKPDGEARAMRQALRMADKTVADIAYINTHGTSSALGDDAEIAAIKTVFKDHIDRIWINATKGLTGHCLYAAGVIEAIATVIQMRQGFVHPNKNLHTPIDGEARFVGEMFEKADIPCALSNSFGFGGINSAIVLTN